MKIITNLHRLIAVFVLFVFALSAGLDAQQRKGGKKKKPSKSKSGNGVEFQVNLGLERQGNIFRMDQADIARFNAQDPLDVAAGRYDKIKGVHDFVIVPEIELGFETKGIGRNPLQLAVGVAYNLHLINLAASFPELSLEAEQKLGDRFWLALEFEFLYGSFRKNYMYDAKDLNGSGKIERDERIYAAGKYGEFEPTLSARFRILEGGKKLFPPELDFTGYVTYHNRWFIPPELINRNRQGILPGAVFQFDFGGVAEFELGYEFGMLFSPNLEEVDVVDEPLVGKDLNGDAVLTNNVRYLQKIDRSRVQHSVFTELTVPFGRIFEASVGFEYRIVRNTTNNQLDISDYRATQGRTTIEAGLQVDFKDDWRFGVEFANASYKDMNTAGVSTFTQTDFSLFARKSF